MLNKTLGSIGKLFTTKISKPWDRICLVVFLVILAIPVFYLLAVICLFIYMFILDHLMYGYTIDLIGFSLLPGITLLVLLIHHIFSKTRSVSRLLRWAVALIFVEVIAYIWLNAWNWEYVITDLSLDDSVVGYALPIEDRLEIILTYTKALFKTVTLGMVLIVARMFIKQK